MDEDEFELSEKTKKDIRRSREDFKDGNVYTLEEIKKLFKIK
jgi:hypothetical protein